MKKDQINGNIKQVHDKRFKFFPEIDKEIEKVKAQGK